MFNIGQTFYHTKVEASESIINLSRTQAMKRWNTALLVQNLVQISQITVQFSSLFQPTMKVSTELILSVSIFSG